MALLPAPTRTAVAAVVAVLGAAFCASSTSSLDDVGVLRTAAAQARR